MKPRLPLRPQRAGAKGVSPHNTSSLSLSPEVLCSGRKPPLPVRWGRESTACHVDEPRYSVGEGHSVLFQLTIFSHGFIPHIPMLTQGASGYTTQGSTYKKDQLSIVFLINCTYS